MKENTQEKSLTEINENNLLYKIKNFFKRLFHNTKPIENNIEVLVEKKDDLFIKSIKNIENEETTILKLQKKYRCGEITEEEITEEQINSLCVLYNKQIRKLKESNELRRKKILEYKTNIQTE